MKKKESSSLKQTPHLSRDLERKFRKFSGISPFCQHPILLCLEKIAEINLLKLFQGHIKNYEST
jgi:hypothetical protein